MVLPAPEGPVIKTNSPFSTLKLISSSALIFPKVFVIPFSSSMADITLNKYTTNIDYQMKQINTSRVKLTITFFFNF